MENNNVEAKVMTRKEKKEARARAEWEKTRNLSYDEIVKAKRGKAKRAILGIVTVLTTSGAAYAAGKTAAINEYKKALARTPEVPDVSKEFKQATPTLTEAFDPSPTLTATTVEPTISE